MVTITCGNDAFSEIFEMESSPVDGQSLLQKKHKRTKGKGKKKLIKPEKPI